MQRDARSTATRAVLPGWRRRQHRDVSAVRRPPALEQAGEDTLRQALARGEFAQVLDMLLQHHQDAMVSYCYSAFLDWHVAQEVAQEIFLAAFEGMPRFRGEASVKTWLYGIASKKCREVGRTHARRAALTRDNHARIGAQVHCDPPLEPEILLRQEEQRRQVWQALRRLRVYDRELLILRYLEEQTCDEIASLLQVSRRTVERHLPRAEARFYKNYQKVQRHGT